MVDNLSFYKVRLVIYSIFLVTIQWVDTIGGYHGSILWVDTIYNTMGGYIPWVNEYHG